MKKLFVIIVVIALALTACGSNVPKGADAKAWNAGYKSLQYLDEWEENGTQPNKEGIAAKIMRELESTGVTDDLLIKSNKTSKEQYLNDMFYALYALGGFVKPRFYTGAVFAISADGKSGTDEDYEHYYECKQNLVDLLEIEYTEDYTLLKKR